MSKCRTLPSPFRWAIPIAALASTCNRAIGGFLAKLMTPHGVYGVFNMSAALTVFIVPILPKYYVAHAIVGVLFGISVGESLALPLKPI